jgi:hypothetical protein
MATQTKERIIATADTIERPANGAQPLPPQDRRTAWDDLKHVFGVYKDDPLAREVMAEVVASRHKDEENDNGRG